METAKQEIKRNLLSHKKISAWWGFKRGILDLKSYMDILSDEGLNIQKINGFYRLKGAVKKEFIYDKIM